MISIIGASILLLIALLETLLIFGLPFGEFTMGGYYKVLPAKYRVLSVISIIIMIFGAIMILQCGGYMGRWFSARMTRYICFGFTIFFGLNALFKHYSEGKKERCVSTPIAMIAASLFFLTILGS